jgi:hypothetical protein
MFANIILDGIHNKIIHEMHFDGSSGSSEKAETTNFFALSFFQVMTSRYDDRSLNYTANFLNSN